MLAGPRTRSRRRRMTTHRRALGGAGWFWPALFISASATRGPRRAAPEDTGMVSAPLRGFTSVLQAKVDAGEIPGAVLLVSRDGKIVLEQAVGWRDREAKVPMTADSIFRIASMTKPVVAVAALILME